MNPIKVEEPAETAKLHAELDALQAEVAVLMGRPQGGPP